MYIPILHRFITISHMAIHFWHFSIAFIPFKVNNTLSSSKATTTYICSSTYKHGIKSPLAPLAWNFFTICRSNTYPWTSHNTTLYLPMINMYDPCFYLLHYHNGLQPLDNQLIILWYIQRSISIIDIKHTITLKSMHCIYFKKCMNGWYFA